MRILIFIFLNIFSPNIWGQSFFGFSRNNYLQNHKDFYVDAFHKIYDNSHKQKKLVYDIVGKIKESNDAGEFDDSEPFQRKIAYWWINIFYLMDSKSNGLDFDSKMLCLLYSNLSDTVAFRRLFDLYKPIIFKVISPKVAIEVDFDLTINDLLKCYNRLKQAPEFEQFNQDSLQNFPFKIDVENLHYGYDFREAVNTKKRLYKPTYYIWWTYLFWFKSKVLGTEKIWYSILQEFSQKHPPRFEKNEVWHWNLTEWKNNILKNKE